MVSLSTVKRRIDVLVTEGLVSSEVAAYQVRVFPFKGVYHFTPYCSKRTFVRDDEGALVKWSDVKVDSSCPDCFKQFCSNMVRVFLNLSDLNRKSSAVVKNPAGVANAGRKIDEIEKLLWWFDRDGAFFKDEMKLFSKYGALSKSLAEEALEVLRSGLKGDTVRLEQLALARDAISHRGVYGVDETMVVVGFKGIAAKSVELFMGAFVVVDKGDFKVMRMPRFAYDYLQREFTRTSSQWVSSSTVLVGFDAPSEDVFEIGASLWAPEDSRSPYRDLRAAFAAAEGLV